MNEPSCYLQPDCFNAYLLHDLGKDKVNHLLIIIDKSYQVFWV